MTATADTHHDDTHHDDTHHDDTHHDHTHRDDADAGTGTGTVSPLWLAHHWPGHYGDRCVRIGRHHVCRRCLALHPLSLVVAFASVAGHPPWPGRYDPAIVWLLSLPATAAYMAEALGWIRYRPWLQVTTMLVAALAFGRALGYELLDRWQPVFWGPIAVFGGLWFFATVIGMRARPAGPPAQ